MGTVALILLILAFAIFALRAAGVTHPRIELMALGLASWVLSAILAGVGKVP